MYHLKSLMVSKLYKLILHFFLQIVQLITLVHYDPKVVLLPETVFTFHLHLML